MACNQAFRRLQRELFAAAAAQMTSGMIERALGVVGKSEDEKGPRFVGGGTDNSGRKLGGTRGDSVVRLRVSVVL
jgi:hypothetical protein